MAPTPPLELDSAADFEGISFAAYHHTASNMPGATLRIFERHALHYLQGKGRHHTNLLARS